MCLTFFRPRSGFILFLDKSLNLSKPQLLHLLKVETILHPNNTIAVKIKKKHLTYEHLLSVLSFTSLHAFPAPASLIILCTKLFSPVCCYYHSLNDFLTYFNVLKFFPFFYSQLKCQVMKASFTSLSQK